MFTLGYAFRPWTEAKSIADGPSILQLRPGHRRAVRHRRAHPLPPPRALRANWSSAEARWTVEVERDTGSGPSRSFHLQLPADGSGYYDYAAGYTPRFAGTERFAGRIVHPQHWPEDLDYDGKRVVVIGSGATAVTLVPAMAKHAAHVTMLQRSPTYIVSRPSEDPIANRLRRHLPARLAYAHHALEERPAADVLLPPGAPEAGRGKRTASRRWCARNSDPTTTSARISRRATIRGTSGSAWCPTPTCSARSATAARRWSPTTIETFTETGMRLASGRELEADIIVTATGLKLNLLGGVTLSVDGARVDLSQAFIYKGMMFSGVPNLASIFGYTNASWTLKTDLTCAYVCRLLNYMRRRGYAAATPTPRPGDAAGAVPGLHVGLRDAGAGDAAQAGVAQALEAAPELRARHGRAAVRPGR